MYVYDTCSVILKTWNVSEKSCRGNQHTRKFYVQYFAFWTMYFIKVKEETNKFSNPSIYWYSTLSYIFRHFKMQSSGSQSWSCWDRCPMLQQTASNHLWFLQHWAPISAGSWLTPWWWHFKVPKHVGECRVLIYWRITAFAGFFIHLYVPYIFSDNRAIWVNVEKHGIARRATDDNIIRHVLFMQDN
jgi:hypothetical protein